MAAPYYGAAFLGCNLRRMPETSVTYSLSPSLTDEVLNDLYAPSWPHHTWFDFAPVLSRALAWVAAYENERLVGFVYVAWDGAQHAFLLEPTVRPEWRHRAIGKELVRRVAEAARDAGCQWLHVDYEPGLAPFYEACGFMDTKAGLIRLND
jgi:GNAT superfamily N-acetyltransferase